jgi:hypothetical protein
MQRPLTVSQNVRVFVGAAVIAIGAMACGGSSGGTGTAGADGGAGTGGGGSGGAGTGGSTPCTLAEVNKIVVTTSTNGGCTATGACHDAAGSAAGLSLTAANWSANLVGRMPNADLGVTGFKSMCAGMGRVYLTAGSNPATGLFLDKLDPAMDPPVCGAHMPNVGVPLSATQFACFKSYFTTLTK